MTNCVNCGAPLKNGVCEYCGTENDCKSEKKIVYMFRGREIDEPTEEMLCDPGLLIIWKDVN